MRGERPRLTEISQIDEEDKLHFLSSYHLMDLNEILAGGDIRKVFV